MSFFIVFGIIFIHCPVLEEILSRYGRIENNPTKITEIELWNDVIYLCNNSEIARDIFCILSDTTRRSRAGMPVCSHLSWAISDAETILTQQRIGAWLGDLYPYKRGGLAHLELLPSCYDTVSGVPDGFSYICGSRWAEFYPFLDSVGVLWLENLNGSLTVNDICRTSGVSRGELSLFLLGLARVDAVRFSENPLDVDVCPLPDKTGKMEGIMYFFIGE